MNTRQIRRAAAVLGWVALMIQAPAAQGLSGNGGLSAITHGVIAGDVTTDSAVIWARADRAGTMHVVVRSDRHGSRDAVHAVPVTSQHDFTGKVRVTGLLPNNGYRYFVWFTGGPRTSAAEPMIASGRFRTAPRHSVAEPITFAFGGDVAGQNVCRDVVDGFPLFETIRRQKPHFFIGLGDMIYADTGCAAASPLGNPQVPGPGPSITLEDFWAHWKYNRADSHSQRLLSEVAYYGLWDDHEVTNDFGPLHDTRTVAPNPPTPHLMPPGLQAMFDYNPILPARNTPDRLYRNVQWGKHVEIFLLDNRQYRDANFEPEDPAAPKTMLGREQSVWLRSTVARSNATWKVIVSGVPMSIPTGPAGPAGARDGWANYDTDKGFELELLEILRDMQQNDVRNILWITTDVHFAAVFRYTPFAEHPDFQVHEIAVGPLNAGVLGKPDFDTTLGTEQLFRSINTPTTWEQAKRAFNFGLIRVGRDGVLHGSVTDITGVSWYDLVLPPR
jgi:alkaline phosphatase D